MMRRLTEASESPEYEEIKDLRVACFRVRRLCQWSRGRPDFGMKWEANLNPRRMLKCAISTDGRKYLEEICAAADLTP